MSDQTTIDPMGFLAAQAERKRLKEEYDRVALELEELDVKIMTTRTELRKTGQFVPPDQWNGWQQRKSELRQKLLDIRKQRNDLREGRAGVATNYSEDERHTFNARFRVQAQIILGPMIYDMISKAAAADMVAAPKDVKEVA